MILRKGKSENKNSRSYRFPRLVGHFYAIMRYFWRAIPWEGRGEIVSVSHRLHLIAPKCSPYLYVLPFEV